MLLKDYIPNIDKKHKLVFFSGISFKSSKVKKDNIFFAIKGKKFDGNNFISHAIKKGARIIVSEKKKHKKISNVIFLYSSNVRKLLAEVSYKIFDKRVKKLVAVTGTNGKSSIADFYYQILNLNNKKVASIGTLGVKSKKFNSNLSNTTTNPIKLGQILEKLKFNKIDNVIMEASSHGLKQNRLDGLKFNSGIFTNLSQDHLDYHRNLQDYLKSKLYLFEKLIKKRGSLITDEKITEFGKIKKIAIKRNLNLLTLNDKNNHFNVISHMFKNESQIIKIKIGNAIYQIDLKLIGKIQIKNLIMAIIAATQSQIKIKNILKIIPKIKSVEGRFEKIGKLKNNSKIILDYAHTPDALKTCLVNLREQFPYKKISLLFGCGGNRDKNKRPKMGRIADQFSDKIYLTDDNPRFENPIEIRKDIKKGIKRLKIKEISNRATAISYAINEIKTGEILLIAGKGHEKTQVIGKKIIYFSDKDLILKSIKKKNFNLSKNLKLNIIRDLYNQNEINSNLSLNSGRINSKEIKKNDIFFAIKGKKKDGNKFVPEAFRKQASLVVVNNFQKNFNYKKQIKVKDSLKFLTECSKIFRDNINTNIIAITGSCGKTSLKELLGNSLKKISTVSISPKSYNNKYGVPLSLFNLSQNDKYGILEIGMDKKGEIDFLSKIIKPDVSVITNINYAHAKNFKNINQIALAKSEIINNTKASGFIVLNADDKFYNFHKKIALKKKLKIISFGIKNKIADIKKISIKKENKNYRIQIKINNLFNSFFFYNNFQNNIYNILASLAVMSIYLDVSKLNSNIFMNFRTPEGRGNISQLKFGKKKINLIDESYNSNPLSLKSAILNFDKIDTKKSGKYLLLGDMLELGKHSKKLHESIVPIINKSEINKIFVKGVGVTTIFNKLTKSKKGKILSNQFQIIEFIKNELNNNDYLMIKGSNATGLNKVVKKLKDLN